MNDDAFDANAEDAPLDETDLALLDELAGVLDQVDPMPQDLVDRVQFSLALDEVYAEVARITREPQDALAVRSDPQAETRTETLTFSAERLTAMVTVTRGVDGTLRVDGWVAPETAVRVQLRMQDGPTLEAGDSSGRFVFEGLHEGFAQLTFHLDEGDEGPAVTVVTPLFQL
jgi:hypothetical protein